MRRWMGRASGLAAVITLGAQGCWASPECSVVTDAKPLNPIIDGADAQRPRAKATLLQVAQGCGQVVDIQFPPGSSDRGVLIDQLGAARWIDFASGQAGTWLELDTAQGWERGLLGMAFHPKFAENGRVFFNWTDKQGGLTSKVGAFKADPTDPWGSPPKLEYIVYEVGQPYSNHNAGGLAFGPDGMLYIGWGDGGKAGDPHKNGQNGKTALGAMLRIDVDGKRPFAVPPDNPWVGDPAYLPEVWAIGLRNPWRYTFDPKGRMVVADVGQNLWEEVTFLTKGSNAGWNQREAAHCYEPAENCVTEGMLEPMWEYSHSEGQSITGGYVAEQPAAVKGRYVVGDFGSGRLWALTLPDVVGEKAQVASIGRFSLQFSTFGIDAEGRVYAADWAKGTVYRLQDAP